MAKSGNSNNTDDYVKVLFDEVMNITSLAHYARIQANDAELRARYCTSLAEKANCEAEAVHQISESLTCTSKMVANMTLNYICSLSNDVENPDSRNVSSDEQEIIETLKQMGSPEKQQESPNECQNIASQTFRTPQKQDFSEKDIKKSSLKKMSPVNIGDSNLDSSSGVLVDTVKHDHSNEHLDKFQEQFPELLVETKDPNAKDLPKEFDSSHSLSLPIVYEDSYQGSRGTKPLTWGEKKNIRKIQRKLREVDLDGNELDNVIEGSEHVTKIVDGKIQYSPPINCGEILIKSVRFSPGPPDSSDDEPSV